MDKEHQQAKQEGQLFFYKTGLTNTESDIALQNDIDTKMDILFPSFTELSRVFFEEQLFADHFLEISLKCLFSAFEASFSIFLHFIDNNISCLFANSCNGLRSVPVPPIKHDQPISFV